MERCSNTLTKDGKQFTVALKMLLSEEMVLCGILDATEEAEVTLVSTE